MAAGSGTDASSGAGSDPGTRTGLELARLGALVAQQGASGHNSREGILRLVEAHGAPVLVEELAEVTGLHHNTVRSHLDVLLSEGRVERTRMHTGGRGRPPWQYEAVTAGRLSDLGRDLAEVLGQPEAEGSAAELVKAWASVAERGPAATPDESVTSAAGALTELGFDASVAETGDAIVLHRCPYAALVREDPGVCRLHSAMVQRLFDRDGQGVGVARVEVWPRPDACVVRLRRPDVRPYAVIEPSDGLAGQPG